MFSPEAYVGRIPWDKTLASTLLLVGGRSVPIPWNPVSQFLVPISPYGGPIRSTDTNKGKTWCTHIPHTHRRFRHTHTHAHTRTRTHTMHTRAQAHTQTQKHTHTHTQTNARTHTQTHTYTHTHTHTHTHTPDHHSGTTQLQGQLHLVHSATEENRNFKSRLSGLLKIPSRISSVNGGADIL